MVEFYILFVNRKQNFAPTIGNDEALYGAK